jgi:hypothetical protein
LLRISHHATPGWRRGIGPWRTWRIIHGSIDVATGKTSGLGLLYPDMVTLSNLTLQLLPADFASLG